VSTYYDNNMKNLFQNLGANEKDMHVFLKMLELGAQPVSVIAKHVGLPRSSTYVILEKLKNLNLTEEFERRGITYVKCIPARSLADLFKTKERKLEQSFQILEEKLPELEALENKLSITPQVRFLEGKEAIMKMYEEVLKNPGFCAAFNPELMKEAIPEYIFKIGEVLQEKKGWAREFVVGSKTAEEYKKRFNSTKHQIKILPRKVTFPSDTIICSNTIYMVSYGDKEVCATEIVNCSLAQTQQAFFEMMWEKF
jgi:sugar-specific transcriptional regulator TrmB